MDTVVLFNGSERPRFEDDSLMPPGFRFHPTDEELITYYLLLDSNFSCAAISQVGLNKPEPWELPDVRNCEARPRFLVFNGSERPRFEDDTLMPPGFRFHPTHDEELITYYLLKKVLDSNFSCAAISQVDLNKSEPWELPEKAKMGEKEWYFFTLRDRKYPTGLRTNRATDAGYWKATGKDREIKSSKTKSLLGMKKTLVFYKGRAPKGEKSCWVMHEYRLDGKFSYHYISSSAKDEWVLCKVCLKSGVVNRETKLISSSTSAAGEFSSTGSAIAPIIDAFASEHVSCFSNNAAHANESFRTTYLPAPPPSLPPRQPRHIADDVAFGQLMDLGSSAQINYDAAAFFPNLPSLPPTVLPSPPSLAMYGGSSTMSYWPFAL